MSLDLKPRKRNHEPLAGQRVTVLGLARQGMALARYLSAQGAQVTVSDLRPAEKLRAELAGLEGLGVRYVLGGHPPEILDGADLLCLSGGVPLDAPIVAQAQERDIPLSNDAQLFLERCPALVIGITGSSGKTTTTALTGRMLDGGNGCMTWVGGNIGRPLIDLVDEIGPDDRVVMELSSFQLEIMRTSPEVAAVLNVTPNHLDRHKTMAVYTAAKQRILDFQEPGDLALLGYDDPGARGLASAVQGQLAYFGAQREVSYGAYLEDDRLMLRLNGLARQICRIQEIKLLGQHNVLNVLAASVLANAAGASLEAIRETIANFSGVEHRLQLVRELKGVRYYDDSIATAPERTAAALLSFEAPIVLLAGGRDKDLPWQDMARLAVERARHVIPFGEAAGLVERAITEASQRKGPGARFEALSRVNSLEEAVEAASRLAQAGDVVLLAPGGTSFDAFKDFAERGERFQALVRALE